MSHDAPATDDKNLLASKTVWINVIMMILSFLDSGMLPIPPHYLLLLSGALNLILRYFTTEPVKTVTASVKGLAGK